MKPDIDPRIFRIASLTLVNAMLFQETIARRESSVKTLQATASSIDIVNEFNKEWEHIETTIDFVPIFKIAREILFTLPSVPETSRSLRTLAKSAIKISNNRAALRHDLMGRIFHRLLADSKYYGAFYTKIPSATLLLRLAIGVSNWSIDWEDPQSISKLRVGDLACGTGTLLKAAASAIVDRHIDSAIDNDKKADPDTVHRQLIENSLWGFDVISSAIHLASAAIAMHDPNVTVRDMHLYALPLGGGSLNLGSIDFAGRTSKRTIHVQKTLIGASVGPEAATTEEKHAVTVPLLHLCTMNPPFTRSVYGNLLFGGTGEQERKELRQKLSSKLMESKLEANITAGLASVFVAIADSMTLEDGALALVLPKAVLSGTSWEPTRSIFQKYDLRYAICSHEPNNWNFSESTQLSEVLLVLTKSGPESNHSTTFINLSSQPKTNIEALSLTRFIEQKKPTNLHSLTGITEIRNNGRRFGEVSVLTKQHLDTISWAVPLSFSQTDLCRSAYYFCQNKLLIPTIGIVGDIKTTKLSEMVDLGPDGRDVYDAFRLTESKTLYTVLWGYDSDAVTRIPQTHNQYLSPLEEALPNRHLRDPNLLWSRAGTLMLAKELRLNTSGIIAVVLPAPSLSNVWWPTRWKSSDYGVRETMERRLALWFNSTLGIFSMLMQRQETEGAWAKFPKTWYENLMVLDFRALDNRQNMLLDNLWNEVQNKTILPYRKMDVDPVRQSIDDVFSKILGIPNVRPLRTMLCDEPIISMRVR